MTEELEKRMSRLKELSKEQIMEILKENLSKAMKAGALKITRFPNLEERLRKGDKEAQMKQRK